MVGWKGDLQPWGSRLGPRIESPGLQEKSNNQFELICNPKKKTGMTALSRMKCCIQLTHQFMLSEVAIPEHQL